MITLERRFCYRRLTASGVLCRAEFRRNPKLVRFLDEHADVVADDLAQHLVARGHGRLAACQTASKD